ncbi:helix-turn-helix domain-containing protein [Bradyrhizobium sp. Arg314]
MAWFVADERPKGNRTGVSSVSRGGAYGRQLAETFGLDAAPALVTKTLQKATIAVTQIICDAENNGLTEPIPREDAFLATVQMRDCPSHDLWIDGKPRKTGHLVPGSISVYDLRQNPIVNSTSPFRNLHFYLPRRALDAIADSDETPRVGEFVVEPGLGAEDPIARGLAMSIVPAFAKPDEAMPLFIDHITVALAGHVLKRYADRKPKRCSAEISLSPLHERRIKEFLGAHPAGDITVAQLANECGIPVSSFVGAFRRATGVAPHDWLEQVRIARARDLVAHGTMPVADVAALAGFSSARHLARALMKAEHANPIAWRDLMK